MASQPLLLPAIPVDETELRSALQSVAIPGYTGSICVEFGFHQAENGKSFIVAMTVLRREHRKVGATADHRQILPDPERKKPVESVLDELRPLLLVRPVRRAIEFHVDNGKILKYVAE
jgi:hypothetical protein